MRRVKNETPTRDSYEASDYEHDAITPGPFMDFRDSLIFSRVGTAPYDPMELNYVAICLPPRSAWTREGLEEARGDVMAFSRDSEAARAYVETRLSDPFSGFMRELAQSFEEEMESFYEGFNARTPDPGRVTILVAVFLRLYDVAGKANAASAPSQGSLRVVSSRSAS